MRILTINLQNLNSLAGRWSIDFTDQEFAAAGIFAITGPTGAGKSTILDAICLALYGRTPRLARISRKRNEIMSRRSGECMAEVEFETVRGRFRCHWSQHRAHRRPDGELQTARHEVADAESGRVLETRRRQVLALVEELTGMDFDRFTRSMLLAQGGFAAFLEAEPDERAPILEQITGTGIYSRISMMVHERLVMEREQLEKLQTELRGMQLLAPEVEEKLQAELTAVEHKGQALRRSLEQLAAALRWLDLLADLARKLEKTEKSLQTLFLRRRDAAADLERLARARRAAGLDALYVELTMLRELQLDDRRAFQTGKDRTRELAGSADRLLAGLREAEQAVADSRKRQEHELEIIQKVRTLDTRIKEEKRRLQELSIERQKLVGEHEDRKKGLAAVGQRIRDLQQDLERHGAYLAGHRHDAGLVENLEGIRQLLVRNRTLATGRAELEAKIRRTVSLLCTAEETVRRKERKLRAADRAATRQQKLLADLQQGLDLLLEGKPFSAWQEESLALAEQERQLEQVLDLLQQRQQAEKDLRQLALELEEVIHAEKRLAEKTAGLEKRMVIQKTLLNSLAENRRLQHRVRDLEQERQYLVAGSPCPLCGATVHPWAGERPVIEEEGALEREQAVFDGMAEEVGRCRVRLAGLAKDVARLQEKKDERAAQLRIIEQGLAALAAELKVSPDREAVAAALEQVSGRQEICRTHLARAEKLQGRVEKARLQVEREKENYVLADRGLQETIHGRDTTAGELQRLRQDLDRVNVELEVIRHEAMQVVRPFTVFDTLPDDCDTLLTELEERQAAWKKAQQEQARLEREHVLARGEQELVREQVHSLQRALDGIGKQAEQHERKLAGQREQRLSLYGQKDPDQEEQRLATGLDKARQRQEEQQKALAVLEQERRSLAEQQDKLARSIEKRTVRLQEQEDVFLQQLAQSGFGNEAEFTAARLDDETLHALIHLEESLHREEAALQARKQELRTTMDREQARDCTRESRQDLVARQQALQEEEQEIQQRIGAIRSELERNRQLAEEQQERLQILQARQQEYARWQRLHELIGSADGKKFRVFAQGLTLDLMIGHANHQLCKMQDRYLLVRGADSLELRVIDNYQAGEIRSTRNLSGGESFIVSLALALGLSAMASRKVRVDSLFLDEGFGTLDEESLDTALQTLAGLQQEGKLIGIISHVPALQERIATRIRVIPGPGGRSRLRGPGTS